MNADLLMSRLVSFINFIQANPILSLLFLFWSFYWKGRALWKAARNNSLTWFIALLVINTLGILEILYVYYFGKEKTKISSKNNKK